MVASPPKARLFLFVEMVTRLRDGTISATRSFLVMSVARRAVSPCAETESTAASISTMPTHTRWRMISFLLFILFVMFVVICPSSTRHSLSSMVGEDKITIFFGKNLFS